MKKLLLLISFPIGCLTASAQPTSFGGITPGQTTREEFKKLVKDPSQVSTGNFAFLLKLKQPDGMGVSVEFHNDIVYEVKVSLTLSPELEQALIEKYGQPRITVGGIRTVTCRNKLGASFQRLDGFEENRWPVKDGVQGVIRRWAGECATYTYKDYLLRHMATVTEIEGANLEQARKRAEESRQKLGNTY